jgi:hypothetical protein
MFQENKIGVHLCLQTEHIQTNRESGSSSQSLSVDEVNSKRPTEETEEVLPVLTVILPVSCPCSGKSTAIEHICTNAQLYPKLVLMHSLQDLFEFESKNGVIPTLLKTGDGHLAQLLTSARQRTLSADSAVRAYRSFFEELGEDMKAISAHMLGGEAGFNKIAIVVDKNFTPKSFGSDGQLKDPGGWHAWIQLRAVVPSNVRVVMVGLYANGMLQALGPQCRHTSSEWPFPYSPAMVVLTAHRMTQRTGHILHAGSGMALAEKVLKGLRSYKLFETPDFMSCVDAEVGQKCTPSDLSKHVLEHAQVAGPAKFDLAVEWPILKEGADELLTPHHVSVLCKVMNLVPNHVELDKKSDPEKWDERCRLVWELLQPIVEELGAILPTNSIEDSACCLMRAVHEGAGDRQC